MNTNTEHFKKSYVEFGCFGFQQEKCYVSKNVLYHQEMIEEFKLNMKSQDFEYRGYFSIKLESPDTLHIEFYYPDDKQQNEVPAFIMLLWETVEKKLMRFSMKYSEVNIYVYKGIEVINLFTKRESDE